MERSFTIRESATRDRAAIEALYPAAFPDEDLLPLVRDLLRDPGIAISLVAGNNAGVIGNIIFTRGSVAGNEGGAALLAPLAVAPTCQGQGVGTALVREGLRRLESEGIGLVFVLGDPAYYSRFGFRREASVAAPYPLPAEWADAWQSRCLRDAVAPESGKLLLPDVWLDPALWSA